MSPRRPATSAEQAEQGAGWRPTAESSQRSAARGRARQGGAAYFVRPRGPSPAPRRENPTWPRTTAPSRPSCVCPGSARSDGGGGGDRGAAAILLPTENFAKDLEMFARHAKRTTINTEDVKLLARRSNSLLKYITDKSEEIAQINLERKAQKKKKSEDGSKNSRQPAEAGVVESEN
ncbi:centromere protein S isoform X3 [Gorilla gorilla gorilla]|uniref:centromere protein S isoform X3 n=1 Tax=Gorilla gorilla gorilla TaxID=9595 RepID=UPI0008F4FB18|nr:centromere protein S isoform X1 [Gorilla gorilla gorilla]